MAFLQLLSYGMEHQYLTDNAEISFFKIIYKRHTNFYMDNCVLDGNDTVSTPSNVNFIIPKSGDLLSTTYIQPFQVKNTFQLFGNFKCKYTLNINILNFYDDYVIKSFEKSDIKNIDIIKINLENLTIQSFCCNKKITNIVKITPSLKLEKKNNLYNINTQFNSYSFIDTTIKPNMIYDILYLNLLFQNIPFQKIKYIQIDLKPLQITFNISNLSIKKLKTFLHKFIHNISTNSKNRFAIYSNFLYFYIFTLEESELFIKYIYDILPEFIKYNEYFNKNDTPIRSSLNKSQFTQIFQPLDMIQIFYISNDIIKNYNSSEYGNLTNNVFNGFCISNYIQTINIFNDLRFLIKNYKEIKNVNINKLGIHKFMTITQITNILQKNNYYFVHTDFKMIELHRFIQSIIIQYLKPIYFKNNISDVFEKKHIFKLFNRYNAINSNYSLNTSEQIIFTYEKVKILFYLSDCLTENILKEYEILNTLTIHPKTMNERIESLITQKNITYLDVEIFISNNMTTNEKIIQSLENLNVSFIDYDKILLSTQELLTKTTSELKLYSLNICNKLLYNNVKKSDFLYYELDEKYVFYNINIINEQKNEINYNDIELFLNENDIYDEKIITLFSKSVNILLNYESLNTQLQNLKIVHNSQINNIMKFEKFKILIDLYYKKIKPPTHDKLMKYFKKYNNKFDEQLFYKYYNLTQNKITVIYESILDFIPIDYKIIINENDYDIQNVKTQILEKIIFLKNIYGGNYNFNSSYYLTQNQLKNIYSKDNFVINDNYVNIFSPFYITTFDENVITQSIYLLYNLSISIYIFNNSFFHNPSRKLILSAYNTKNIENFKLIVFNDMSYKTITLFFNTILQNELNENVFLINEPQMMLNINNYNLKSQNNILNLNIVNSKINNISFMVNDIYNMSSSNITDYLKSVIVEDVNIVQIIFKNIFKNNPLINESGILQTFQKVELFTDDSLIDTITQDYYKLFFQTNTNANKYMATREMLGLYDNYITKNEMYPYIITLNEKQFYIPVIFFIKDRFNAFILISSMYNEIKINITTNGLTILNNFYNPVQIVKNKTLFKYSLSLDFILLERDERIKKSNEITNNLIETHSQINISNSLMELNTSDNDDFLVLPFQFNLKNMVKQIFFKLNFYINDYEFDDLNEFIVSFIFTIDGLRRDGIVPFTPNKPTKNEIITDSYVKTYPSYSAISQYLTTYRYNIRAPVIKYYSYSFALQPDLFQPSGAINMSCNEYFGINVFIDKNKLINFLKNNNIETNNFKKISLKMSLFVHGYNIIRYQSGLCNVLYS